MTGRSHPWRAWTKNAFEILGLVYKKHRKDFHRFGSSPVPGGPLICGSRQLSGSISTNVAGDQNLHHLKEPVFTADPVFQKLFQLTEYNKLKTEDGQMIIDRERDMRNIQRSWEQQGIEKGIEQGIEKGKLLFVRKLIRRTNFNDREVASLTGVDEECVRDLRADL